MYYDFIDGKATVPTYQSVIETTEESQHADTAKQVNYLKELNRFGFITIDSQNGVEERKYNTITGFPDAKKVYYAGEFQRAYVEGFIPSFLAQALEKNILHEPLFMLRKSLNGYHQMIKDTQRCTDPSSRCLVTYFEEQETKTSEIIREPYTYFSGQNRLDALEHIDNFIERHLDEGAWNVFMDNLDYVGFIDPVWGRESWLTSTVLKYLKLVSSNIQKTWTESCMIYDDSDLKTLQEDFIFKNKITNSEEQQLVNQASKREMCYLWSFDTSVSPKVLDSLRQRYATYKQLDDAQIRRYKIKAAKQEKELKERNARERKRLYGEDAKE